MIGSAGGGAKGSGQETVVSRNGGVEGGESVANFGDLVPGTRVRGLTASGAVEVVAVEKHGESAATIVYRTADGVVYQQVVLAANLPMLKIEAAEAAALFDGDAPAFRL